MNLSIKLFNSTHNFLDTSAENWLALSSYKKIIARTQLNAPAKIGFVITMPVHNTDELLAYACSGKQIPALVIESRDKHNPFLATHYVLYNVAIDKVEETAFNDGKNTQEIIVEAHLSFTHSQKLQVSLSPRQQQKNVARQVVAQHTNVA